MTKDLTKTGKAVGNDRMIAAKHAGVQRKMLIRGKTPGIKLFEKWQLVRQGRKDGASDLVRPVSGKEWSSTFISRESNSLSEYCDKVWGLLQIDNLELLCRLGELAEDMEESARQIAEINERIETMTEAQTGETISRKRGEEALSEGQIKERRARERAKRLAPLYRKKSRLEERISEGFEEASILRNRMIENCNSARMVCERIKEHTCQRIDVYWHAAMLSSPTSKDMPVVPAVELSPKAEETYFRNHGTLLRETDERLRSIAGSLREEISGQDLQV